MDTPHLRNLIPVFDTPQDLMAGVIAFCNKYKITMNRETMQLILNNSYDNKWSTRCNEIEVLPSTNPEEEGAIFMFYYK